MNSKERIQCAMHHGIPDRVPVMCQLSFGHIIKTLGLSPSRFQFHSETMAEGFARMREMYRFDGILVNNLHCMKPEDFFDKVRLQVTDEEELLYLSDGDYYRCPFNDDANLVTRKKLPDIEDIDPDDIEPVTQFDDYRVKTQKLLVEWSHGEYSVHGETSSPFDWLTILLGLEGALMALLTEPEKCTELLEKYALQSFAFAKKQMDVGCDAIKISSPFVGSSFISTGLYQQFVQPYEGKLVSMIHEYRPGIPVYTHTCGFINDRLELMRDTGIDGIECLDPAPLGNVSLADAKRRIGKELFIKGNMDSVNCLLDTTADKVREYVKGVLADGMAGGGYILSSACSVAPGVSPEILKLLTPLAEEFGTY